MSFQIAIDGPAGAGKSTIAKNLAKKTGALYVDTGAMYRTIALYFLRAGLALDSQEQLKDAIGGIEVTLGYTDGTQKVYLNGEDVSTAIRDEEVGKAASLTSAYGFVREKLLDLQRQIAASQDVIMDGRDIGTCVLPDAQLKVYLTASVSTRAMRRFLELREKGVTCELSAIEADIIKRDEQDMTRAIAPLKQAEDAVLVDSSDLTIEEVVDTICAMAYEHGFVKNKEPLCGFGQQ